MRNKPICYVEKPGMFTTIQDEGRVGYQRKGIPVSGVMDWYSFTCANILAGNPSSQAVLEITMTGPVLSFAENTVIAITGADMKPEVNGNRISMWKSQRIQKNDVLTFKGAASGVRSYLAVHRGFDGDQVLNSKSTYVKANMGGIEGRALQKGDVLCSDINGEYLPSLKALHPDLIPSYSKNVVLRVLDGPEKSHFTREALDVFYQTEFRVSNLTDRMGIRLQGSPLQQKDKADILSDAVSFGTIQVAAEGQPMILMADRQTTGGYTRIANVISVDLPSAAQLRPGQRVSFQKASIEEAQDKLIQIKKQLDHLRLVIMEE